MTAPLHKFIVLTVDSRGERIGAPEFVDTRNAATEGAKEMIRKASQGASVYIYKAVSHLEMNVTYNVVDD